MRCVILVPIICSAVLAVIVFLGFMIRWSLTPESTAIAIKELTKMTWDDAVEGKQVFIMFLAPWHYECKRIKPAWDRLIEEFNNSETLVVADVDCTRNGTM